MLLLLFSVGQERYALSTRSVVEVIPRVNLMKYHGLLTIVAGQFNYQGQLLPVIDLSQLLGNEPCPLAWRNRIIIVDLDRSRSGQQLLGLLVEQATETVRSDRLQPAKDSLNLSHQAYLGEVLLEGQSMIQCLNVEQLLSEESYDRLLTPVDIAGTLMPEEDAVD